VLPSWLSTLMASLPTQPKLSTDDGMKKYLFGSFLPCLSVPHLAAGALSVAVATALFAALGKYVTNMSAAATPD
jgi:hypothetical protein